VQRLRVANLARVAQEVVDVLGRPGRVASRDADQGANAPGRGLHVVLLGRELALHQLERVAPRADEVRQLREVAEPPAQRRVRHADPATVLEPLPRDRHGPRGVAGGLQQLGAEIEVRAAGAERGVPQRELQAAPAVLFPARVAERGTHQAARVERIAEKLVVPELLPHRDRALDELRGLRVAAGKDREARHLSERELLSRRQRSSLGQLARAVEIRERARLVAALPDDLASGDRRLRGGRGILVRKLLGRTLEHLHTLLAEPSSPGEREAVREQEGRIVADGRVELAQPFVRVDPRIRRTDRPRPVARLPERPRRSRHERRGVDPGEPRVLDRLDEMVREDLAPVERPVGRQLVDPVRDSPVDVRARGARHLPVRPVADERVDERVLARAGHGRAELAAHELLALEGVQALLERFRLDAGEARERVRPEDLAQDRPPPAGATSAPPVLTPIRTSSASAGSAAFICAIASWIARAARTARSGSSSCAAGAPKTATTASPMNFSTVPPWRSSSWRSRAWYGASRALTSSGSRRSARSVEPTMSAKTTVTTLRSSRGVAAAAASGAPHSEQNFAVSACSVPQAAQGRTGRSYERARRRASALPAGRVTCARAPHAIQCGAARDSSRSTSREAEGPAL
jgi:hypothetical protein